MAKKPKGLKVGDSVTIWYDPITQNDREGEAFVRRIHSMKTSCGVKVYDLDVEFVTDAGVLYRRQLYRG